MEVFLLLCTAEGSLFLAGGKSVTSEIRCDPFKSRASFCEQPADACAMRTACVRVRLFYFHFCCSIKFSSNK